MTAEQIEKFITGDQADVGETTKIFFKTRATVEGIFIQAADYFELKGKNFWRIVTLKHLEDYRRSKDMNLSRIYNGAEFIRLSQK